MGPYIFELMKFDNHTPFSPNLFTQVSSCPVHIIFVNTVAVAGEINIFHQHQRNMQIFKLLSVLFLPDKINIMEGGGL